MLDLFGSQIYGLLPCIMRALYYLILTINVWQWNAVNWCHVLGIMLEPHTPEMSLPSSGENKKTTTFVITVSYNQIFGLNPRNLLLHRWNTVYLWISHYCRLFFMCFTALCSLMLLFWKCTGRNARHSAVVRGNRSNSPTLAGKVSSNFEFLTKLVRFLAQATLKLSPELYFKYLY